MRISLRQSLSLAAVRSRRSGGIGLPFRSKSARTHSSRRSFVSSMAEPHRPRRTFQRPRPAGLAPARRLGRRLLFADLLAPGQPACGLSVRDLERSAIEPAGTAAGRPPCRATRLRLGHAGRVAEWPATCLLTSRSTTSSTMPRHHPASPARRSDRELIDRNTRRLVARQSFAATAPVAQANSAAAAASLARPVPRYSTN